MLARFTVMFKNNDVLRNMLRGTLPSFKIAKKANVE